MTPRLVSLAIPVFVLALATSALGQEPTPKPPCVPATGDLQAYATRLDRMWGTRTALLVCDGAYVRGSHAQPGTVFFVPQEARALGFDGLGVVYIIAHEWGHQVQFQRLGIAHAVMFTQAKEFQADCFAGYFIGATLPYTPDTEQRLMSAAAAIGDDRLLHAARLSGPFGNVIDQYTTPNAHGNAQGRSTFVQMGYRDGRQRGPATCAVPYITPNLR